MDNRVLSLVKSLIIGEEADGESGKGAGLIARMRSELGEE
jgi:hypothetical protein